MAKQAKAKNVAVLAIFLFVAIMAIGEFGGLFSIFFYGGANTIYVGDAISVSGSRSSTELKATCDADANHIFRIYKESQPTNALQEVKKNVGKITLVNSRYMFGDGSGVSSYSYSATAGYPLLPDSYFAKEWIECNGAVITKDVQIYYFKIVSRPTTPTIIKKCGNLGENQKTSSCYYKTCEVQANGNWDWSAIKQSSTFCDYVPPATTTPNPQSPSCTSDWKTSAWSDCVNSIQTRQVYDNNQCSWQTGTKPTTQQSCISLPVIVEPPVVQPPVDNGTDAGMTDAEKLQYCKDKGFTNYDIPTNTCTKVGANTSTDFVSQYKWYIAGAVILLFAWASGLMVYLSKK